MSDSYISEWIDAEADRFESIWQTGQPPDIGAFLRAAAPEHRSPLARELVQIDRAYRAQHGTMLTWESYRAAYPDLPAEPESRPAVDRHWPAIPGFEVTGVLGSDGMGVVYRARQVQPPRAVALKMLRGPSDAELLTRFRQETEAVARLQHPNIVQIFACGEHAGQPYMALELVAGGNLAERLAGQPQLERAAARLVATLARTIDFVHQQGIIHRDLKPANILLSGTAGTPLESCVPKIADFGLAKFLDRDAGPSQTGSALGSPSYMAPEQASGRARAATPAADTYGLGAILYVLLTGRPPFLGQSVLDTLDQVTRLEPVPPRRLRPTLPRDLETICLKCLRKNRADRYGSAADLADDLGRFLEGKPVLARPVSMTERSWRTIRRHPVVSGLLLAVIASLLIGSVVSALFAFESRRQEGIARDKSNLAEGKAAEARKNLYVAHMQLLDIDWKRGNLNRMREVLDRYAHPTPDEPELRGWEWHFNQRRLMSPLRTLEKLNAVGRQIALSPDGRWLVVTENSQSPVIRVLDPRDLSEVHRWPIDDANVTAVAILPDNKRIALGARNGVVQIRDIHSGAVQWRLQGNGKQCLALLAMPDGRAIITRDHIGDLRLCSLDENPRIQVIQHGFSQVAAIALSADGSLLACTDRSEHVMLIDMVADPPRLKKELVCDRVISALCFSPDNTSIACGCEDGVVLRMKIGADQPIEYYRGHSMLVTVVCFSSDGKWLLSGSNDSTIRFWSTVTKNEAHLLRGHDYQLESIMASPHGLTVLTSCNGGRVNLWPLTGPPNLRRVDCGFGLFAMAYQPQGTMLAVSGGSPEVHLLDALTGRPIRRLPGHVPSVMGIAFDHTGRRLATADVKGVVRIWNPMTGKLLRTIAAHSERVDTVAFSPDGALLASAGRDRSICLWHADTGAAAGTLHGHTDRVHSVAFSYNGRWLASAADDHTVRLWDVAERMPRATLRGHSNWVYSVRFSPDDRTLVSASHDKTVRIWDVETATERAVIRGHQDWVWPTAFNPEGTRLVTSSGDWLVKIWDMVTLQEVQSLDEHVGRAHLPGGLPPRPYSMAMSPDGHSIASGGDDGYLVIRHAEPWSRAVALQREALAALDVLVEQKRTASEIRAMVPNLYVTDEVRQRIQTLLPRYFPSED